MVMTKVMIMVLTKGNDNGNDKCIGNDKGNGTDRVSDNCNDKVHDIGWQRLW